MLTHAQRADAASILVNNGLAPPNPDNVLDIQTGTFDLVYIRNAGCPPEPITNIGDPCPAPGGPTAVEVPAGAFIAFMTIFESSSLLMTGGEMINFGAIDDSSVTIVGGTLGLFGVQCCLSNANATVEIHGGVLAMGPITVNGNSSFTIFGTGFQVDGQAVASGPVTEALGTLTGTLSNGDPINIAFDNAGGGLALASPASLPSLVILPQLALIASLALGGFWITRGSTPIGACETRPGS